MISNFTTFMQSMVGNHLFSRSTVYAAIRDEIKLHFSTQEKQTNEWHLSHLVDSILSKSEKRLFVRSVSGLTLDGIETVKSKSWQLMLFTDDEINKFAAEESGDREWKSHVKDYLTKNFKDKISLLVEAEGDLETAKSKAHAIATFVINTLRYFICIHAASTEHAHDFGSAWMHRHRFGALMPFPSI